MTGKTRTVADHALRAVDSEVRRVRGSLRELVVLAVVGGLALCLAIIGILIVAMGAYAELTPTHGAWQAGLIVGCLLVGIAVVAMLVTLIGVAIHRRRRRLQHMLARRALTSDIEMLRQLASLGGSGGRVPVVPLIALAAGVAVAFLRGRKD